METHLPNSSKFIPVSRVKTIITMTELLIVVSRGWAADTITFQCKSIHITMTMLLCGGRRKARQQTYSLDNVSPT